MNEHPREVTAAATASATMPDFKVNQKQDKKLSCEVKNKHRGATHLESIIGCACLLL